MQIYGFEHAVDIQTSAVWDQSNIYSWILLIIMQVCIVELPSWNPVVHACPMKNTSMYAPI